MTAEISNQIKAGINARIIARDKAEGDKFLEFEKVREAERAELRAWMASRK